MVRITTLESTYLHTSLEVRAYRTRNGKRLKVELIDKDFCVMLSEEGFGLPHKNLQVGEFIVLPVGARRALVKELRLAEIFIDTGRRIEYNPNLWGEIWQLRPEQLSLILKKEADDERQTTNQSECELYP
jgi:hypothetical protein